MAKTNISKLINGRIWRLSWPMMLSNLCVPLLALTDTFVLGHLDQASALAGVALASNLFVSIVWIFGFLRMGTTSVVARSSRNEHSILLTDTVRLSAVIAIPLVALFALFGPSLLSLYGASAEVSTQAWQYLAVRSLSIPLVLMNYSLLGWFIGRHDSRTPMVVLITSNSINIVLDIWWVLGLGWGVAGAALATVTADSVAFVICMWAVAKRHRVSPLSIVTAPLVKAGERWAELFRVNSRLFIRTLLILAVFAYITAVGARFGELALAANAIILQLLAVAAYGLDGVANAAEAMVGRYARYKRKWLRDLAIVQTGYWSGLMAIAFSVVFYLGQNAIVTGLTSIEALQQTVNEYYFWILILPIASFASYWYDGVCLGLGRTEIMLQSMFYAVILFAAGQIFVASNHHLLLTLVLFNLVRGLAQWWLLGRRKSNLLGLS